MQITKNIEIIDLCLFLTKSKTLIIPDVHIGYEEALNKKGILIPRTQFVEIMKNIEKIIKQIKKKFKRINKIVIMGDLKHEFGIISETEWRQTLRFLDFLIKYCQNITLIRGNHDKILGPIAKKRELNIEEHVIIDDVYLTHGHQLPKSKLKAEKQLLKTIKTIIIGHEHAAITLRDGPRVEKFKCFLKGKWKPEKKLLTKSFDLIVMPSFNPIIEGTDVLKEALLSPFLKKANIKTFETFIVGDKVYNFGKISRILKKK
ncbi:metallophosphoesterase [Candidatus Woesearchaeota archaeon]|nr:metallophosphoesterase [Candidatus Woesearchaeota archaeon]